MPDDDQPQSIIDALPPHLRAAAQDALDDQFLSGGEALMAHPAQYALAKDIKCAEPGCHQWAELGDKNDRCRQHKKSSQQGSHMYDRALQKAPSLAEIQNDIREGGEFDKLDEDIILLRALTAKFLEKNAQRLEEGDTATILMAQELINKSSLLIERRNGKKYTVTLTGINVVIQQVVSILELHLESQPELLKRIALDLAKIKLPQGSLSK